MLIPREDDKIRLYIELGLEDDVVNKETGRVDRSLFNAERLIQARLSLLQCIEAT